MNTPTLSNTLIPQTSKDKLFILCAIGAGIAGMAFSLNSVGYLLGFNATTLALYGLFFTVMSLNWIVRAEPVNVQLTWSLLAAVPIATRMVFNMPLFQEVVASIELVASTTALQQLRYMAQVVGIWLLVAVCEETFRATMLNTAITWMPETLGIRGLEIQLKEGPEAERWEDLTASGKATAMVFSIVTWLVFHFLQRPLDFDIYGPYMIWLFVAGATMGYALVKAGLGAATVIHLLVNLTA